MLPEDKQALTIAKRTLKNLNFVYESKQKGNDVEEFTQLLNSMLGMIISLREEYFKGRVVAWEVLEQYKLKKIDIKAKMPDTASPNLTTHTTFSQLIANIRHGFSHNCFLLVGNKDNVISGITIWNIPFGKENATRNRCWEVTMTEEELKGLATLFVSFISKDLGEI
ncbi:HEPN family nuclease [Geomonas subterranea]|uniref:HEPN family nuclease n=1 Tax=Geomonas subterranea TaxID=2847989 RepID=UPI001CD30518|nr:HEPN family nuclease [Geomonas fuzhouensis]